MELTNKEIYNHQMFEFKTMLNRLSVIYSMLVEKRLNDTLTRDEYMVYDMIDMFIPLLSFMDELVSETPYASYMVEKLNRVKSYVDTTLRHFEAKCKEEIQTNND